MPDSKINAGDVSITLDGQTVTLRPSLNAIIGINAQYGGMREARARLAAEDFEAATVIIRHGLGLTDAKSIAALPEQVYRTGLRGDLLLPLFSYLAILANGGQPVGGSSDKAGDDASGNA